MVGLNPGDIWHRDDRSYEVVAVSRDGQTVRVKACWGDGLEWDVQTQHLTAWLTRSSPGFAAVDEP
jgi:hypothetical protein